MQKNILFIMCDQLRWDYLSCYGHPTLKTPNIDRLAERGVRFDRTYCQAPLCGPSRASFYTGRYMSSHGIRSNDDPYKPGEKFLGDYLRETGLRTFLISKSGVKPNIVAMQHPAIESKSSVAKLRQTGGFEEVFRDDGLHPDPIKREDYEYNAYLRDLGYDPDNGWDRNANSTVDENGNVLSGWQMRNARYPANIAEEHSETAYTTDRAIEFMREMGDESWCLHLSYNKPHWPYIAPAPYHNMYSTEDMIPVVCSEDERENPHPVYGAFMEQDYSENFSRDEVRKTVIPAYMGLIKQLDDHIGRLFTYMDETGLTENTLIVFTSDHGDYMGDHWLGEKDLFHEPSVRIPLLIADPSAQADSTRGTVSNRFVEAIDLLPTFVEFAGGKIETQRIEGYSLLPILHGKEPDTWRDYAVSECDYSDRGVRGILDIHPYDCRAYMIRDERYKLVFHELYRPQLFDLKADPDELIDRGKDDKYAEVRQRLIMELFRWLRNRRNRTEIATETLFKMGPDLDEQYGILIGHW